MATKILELST
ncbi:hypothetical protein BpHYR1_054208 [Brachionus plicatilis]|uniref:Uncharacterized protein n=1 Tax=Brachionus plicatilis TaxID=10195 RepID=A0A3M7P3I7_BRAPC|nr:hypothetical protein BpHYR1_054208 [Brachionus plicatilis]